MASAVAAATVSVSGELLAVLTATAWAVGTAPDSVTVADDCATVAAPIAVAGDGVVTVLTAAERDEFDSAAAGADAVGSSSGAGIAGGALVSEGSAVPPVAAGWPDSGWGSTTVVSSNDSAPVDNSDSVALVCVPPLLLTVTPGATWVLEEVVPDAFVVSAAVVPVPVDVDPLVDVDPVPVLDVAAVPGDDSPVDVELAEPAKDDSEDVPVVSALATPGEAATITPIPKVAANAPTRPMYLPSFAELWTALGAGVGLVDALDERDADRGLAVGKLPVMSSAPMAKGLFLIVRSKRQGGACLPRSEICGQPPCD